MYPNLKLLTWISHSSGWICQYTRVLIKFTDKLCYNSWITRKNTPIDSNHHNLSHDSYTLGDFLTEIPTSHCQEFRHFKLPRHGTILSLSCVPHPRLSDDAMVDLLPSLHCSLAVAGQYGKYAISETRLLRLRSWSLTAKNRITPRDHERKKVFCIRITDQGSLSRPDTICRVPRRPYSPWLRPTVWPLGTIWDHCVTICDQLLIGVTILILLHLLGVCAKKWHSAESSPLSPSSCLSFMRHLWECTGCFWFFPE